MISHTNNILCKKMSYLLSRCLTNNLKKILNSELKNNLSEFYGIGRFPDIISSEINIRLQDTFNKFLSRSLENIFNETFNKSFSNILCNQLRDHLTTTLSNLLTKEIKKHLAETLNERLTNSLSEKFNVAFNTKIKISLYQILNIALIKSLTLTLKESSEEVYNIILDDCVFTVLHESFGKELYDVICGILFDILFETVYNYLTVNSFDKLSKSLYIITCEYFTKDTSSSSFQDIFGETLYCTLADSLCDDTTKILSKAMKETFVLRNNNISNYIYDCLKTILIKMMYLIFFGLDGESLLSNEPSNEPSYV